MGNHAARSDQFPGNIKLLKRKHRIFGATQLVWDKLEQTASKVALVRARSGSPTPAEAEILNQCSEKIELARDQIDRFYRRSYSFWDLIHQADEILVKAMPRDMLYVEAVDVLAKFDRKVRSRKVRSAWLGSDGKEGPLRLAVRELESIGALSQHTHAGSAARDHLPSGAPAADPRLERHRCIIESALRIVNEQRDRSFWRLGTNVSIQVASSLLLLTLLGVSYVLFTKSFPWASSWAGGDCPPSSITSTLSPVVIFMLGAAGAIVSNMFRDEPFVTSVGPTSRYFLYNLIAKPVVGGFTALFVLWLERSQLLFEIGVQSQVPAQPHAAILLSVGTCAAAEFARAVIAIASGFAGDRLLGAMVGQVLRPLWRQAEKGSAQPNTASGGHSAK